MYTKEDYENHNLIMIEMQKNVREILEKLRNNPKVGEWVSFTDFCAGLTHINENLIKPF